MFSSLLFTLLAGWLYNFTIHCLQVVPERAEVTYLNHDFIVDAYLKVRRNVRRGPYVINLYGEIKHTWANNISLDVILYEFLHNEYKRTFVEFHFRFCDLINNDPYIGKAMANVGIICPAPPGKYNLTDIRIPADNFPYVWPFERAKGFCEFTHSPTGKVIANASLYLQFKQKPLGKTTKK